MKKYSYDKFMDKIIKQEKLQEKIDDIAETPQEHIYRRRSKNYRHHIKWGKFK
jgi:hypothetical protein